MPQKSTEAVTVLILVGTGSKYEKKDISGISHFLEHMFFKGTKKRPDKLEIAETLDRVGGIYNAFTGEDYTGYFAKVSASRFDLALDWVSDIFLNSLLPEKEAEKEKGVIVEEINMIHDNPMAHVGVLWSKLLYGDQPAGWDIAGSKESVGQMTRQRLLDYMKSQYVASNTVVCVAGKISNGAVVNKIKKHFSGIRQTSFKTKARVLEKQNQLECLLYHKETDQTHLCFGARGYNLFHPLKYAQDVLGVILGGMMSSRLFMEVRDKLGLAYYIKTEVDANPDTGYLVTQAGVDNKNTEKAISVILREYQKISQKKIPADELSKAKDHITGKMALILESSDALASLYGSEELLQKEVITPEQIYAKINKVSANDILRVAKDVFRPEKLNLALVGPFKDQESFRKILSA